jgi:hypothetical protein
VTRLRAPSLSASLCPAALFLALAFLVLHLPYLPRSLEDLDSINFALGLRHFDVAHHQPHPPGYPVFIAAAKIAHAVVASEARALALLSVLAATLGVVALPVLFRLFGGTGDGAWPLVATAVAITSPLYWFTAVRPLSDATGLAAALAGQALTLAAETPRAVCLASFCAGLAAGIRSQVVWLTVPLLIVRGAGITRRALAVTIAAFAAGVLLWLVPLVALSGGPGGYWRALSNQGSEDLSGIRMLWTTPTLRELVEALYYALVAPWAVWPVAVVVMALAVIGVASLARERRSALTLVTLAFGPYFLFDVLFQETFTGRYALPLVVPVAFLASRGLRRLTLYPAIAIAAAVVVFDAHVGGTTIAAYSRQTAPAFRLLADMTDLRTLPAPVAGMDRREDLDLRRPIEWLGATAPTFARRLPAPPQHEWLELVKYWNSGGRSPVWFVADPRRTDIQLIQHLEPAEYRWALPYPVLVSGVRPNEMDWYRVDRPEWYVGEGWALTPEAAGVAAVDRRGPSFGPIEGWVRADVLGGSVVIGGRSFEPAARPRVTLSLQGTTPEETILQETVVAPGFFVEVVGLPLIDLQTRTPDYLRLVVRASPGARIAVEQFDASATRPLVGFGDGWHEQEYDASIGRRWRWLSERGQLRVSARRPVVLRLDGESPLKYFSHGSRLVVRARDRVVFDAILASDFSLTIPIADPVDVISLETDQTYVPAERSWRATQDHRRLGLRIFRCDLHSPAS